MSKNISVLNKVVGNKNKKREVTYLSAEEIEKVLKECESNLHPKYTSRYIILTAFLTGARIGEITALHWEDIDFQTFRNTKGVKGISLRENDKVSDAIILKTSCAQIISVTKNGMIKKSERGLFAKGSRANKGNIIHKIQDGDSLVSIGAIYPENKNVSISSTSAILKFSLNEVRLSDRSTIGTKAINLKDNQYVTGMIIE